MEIKEMNEHKERVCGYILNHRDKFPVLPDAGILNGISLLCSDEISEKFEKLISVNAMALKDTEVVVTFNKQVEMDIAKLYDIYLNIPNIRKSLDFIRKDAPYLDTMIKSTITHELLHCVSVGFVEEDVMKDEAFTDYFARCIYGELYPAETFYTTYEYQKGKDREKYLFFYSGIEKGNEKEKYFKGR